MIEDPCQALSEAFSFIPEHSHRLSEPDGATDLSCAITLFCKGTVSVGLRPHGLRGSQAQHPCHPSSTAPYLRHLQAETQKVCIPLDDNSKTVGFEIIKRCLNQNQGPSDSGSQWPRTHLIHKDVCGHSCSVVICFTGNFLFIQYSEA